MPDILTQVWTILENPVWSAAGTIVTIISIIIGFKTGFLESLVLASAN